MIMMTLQILGGSWRGCGGGGVIAATPNVASGLEYRLWLAFHAYCHIPRPLHRSNTVTVSPLHTSPHIISLLHFTI